MKKYIKNILFVALLVLIGTRISVAQQVNTQYFLENVPTRHYLNPAFQPINKVYVSLPVLGYTQFGLTNNSLTMRDVLQYDNGKTILLKDKYSFYESIRNTTTLRTDLHTNLLGFGFRTGNAYWTFSLSEKVDGQFHLPKDLFKLFIYGNPANDNNFNFKSLGFDATAYTEAALGYSREINDKWTVGGKLKFLYGTANFSTQNNSFDLYAGADKWKITGSGVLNISSPAEEILDAEERLDIQFPNKFEEWLKPAAGLGAGIDLGATYKPIEQLTLSLALVDLGFIHWNRNSKNMAYSIDYEFNGFNLDGGNLESIDFDHLLDSVFTALEESVHYDTKGTSPFTTSISPKLNIGAEYGFWDYKLSLGILSRTMLHKSKLYEELTASITGRPANWFNMSLSYSIMNGRFSNVGAGIGLRTGIINWHLSADYVPLVLAKYKNDSFEMPLPYNTKGLNLAFGVNFVFGNRQDKDRDKVPDKYDLCPDTPKKVKVDARGCPLDSDGDGVPDYLDLCPDTPVEVNGMVDKNGCLLDSDGDGIPDYLDKCPDTPKGAYSTIDKDGCPLDSDGDGVPDYLDLCPDTPIEVNGMVDENGCPLDSDGDGILDYLDKCPDTPKEANGMVDENGCPLDSDGDGIPDYLDKCPNTSKEAKGMVDENGCPLDSDGDGIPDYLDYCPRTPGVKSNNGCPELKREVRNLFQKALQGIAFESGKDVIKQSSYSILDQIAQVMVENSTYMLEIQGHTDNVGKKESNLMLSEKRAEAVRNYLVRKGVNPLRLLFIGYGDERPVDTNATAAGRAKNRRVEFIVSFEEVTYE